MRCASGRHDRYETLGFFGVLGRNNLRDHPAH